MGEKRAETANRRLGHPGAEWTKGDLNSRVDALETRRGEYVGDGDGARRAPAKRDRGGGVC